MQLYRRKDSPYVWVQGYDSQGKRRHASTKCTDDRTAKAVARRIERRWLLEDTRHEPLPLHEALELLRAHKVRKGCAPATMEILAEKGGWLLRIFGPERDVCTLTLADTEGYLDARTAEGVSLHTVAKELGTLRSALRQARRHARYPGDPSDIWPESLRDVYTPREAWLTITEFRKLWLAIDVKWRDHLTAYCYTGVRHSELYTLRGSDLDVRRRSLRVRGTKTEKADRELRLSPDALEVMQRRKAQTGNRDGLLFPDRWEKSWMARCLKAASAEARLRPGVSSANDLRRTFASWMANASVPEATTAKLMGHASSAMVRRVYAQLHPDTLQDAVDRLPRHRTQRSNNVAAHPANHAPGASNAPQKPAKKRRS